MHTGEAERGAAAAIQCCAVRGDRRGTRRAATAATLAEIAEDNLARTLTAAAIWRELELRGLRRVALRDVESVAAPVEEATRSWRRSVTREHLKPAIPRSDGDTDRTPT